MKKSDLSAKTVAELRALAKTAGLTGCSTLRKAELVDRLAAAARPKTTGRRAAKPTAADQKAAGRKAAKPKAAKQGVARPTTSKRKPPARKGPARGKAVRRRSSARGAAVVGRAGPDVESLKGRGLSPRTRRAFSIYRALGEQRVKASKYYLGVRQSPELDEGFTFPQTHGENMVFLMVRDPYWLFAYWEFSPDLNEELVDQIGEDVLARSRLVLRVYDVTGVSADSPVTYHDIDIAPGARDWYINVTRVESDYCVDIGLILPDGSFLVIARSNRISLPPIGPSDEVDERWVTLESLDEIYALAERGPTSGSGGWGSGGWGQG